MATITVEVDQETFDKWDKVHDKPAYLKSQLSNEMIHIPLIMPFLRAAEFKDDNTVGEVAAYIDRLDSLKGQ